MKRLLYGAIPYYLTKIFSSHSPSLKYYKYIKDHKYSRHLYEFREEYDDMEVHIQMDESRGLHYVLKDGKRLYFRRNTPLDKIARNYRELVMEQDKRSPHHYLESIKEVTGKTFVDIGCIIRKSKFPQNPKRSVRFSGKRTKRSVQKRKARNTQKAETKVL